MFRQTKLSSTIWCIIKKLSGKKAENTTHNEEKNKSLEADSEMMDVTQK